MQSFFSKKENSSRNISDTKADSSKITLFYKATMLGAYFLLAVFMGMSFYPNTASASFLGNIFSAIVGNTTQADTLSTPVPDIPHNSQTVPLLESNLTPELKNTVSYSSQGTVGEQAIEATEGANTGPEIEKYATSAKILTYTVKNGDTINGIAKKLKISKDSVSYAANLDKGESLKPGQILAIIPISVPLVDKAEKIVKDTPKNKDIAVTASEKPKKVIAAAPIVDNAPDVAPTPAPTPTPIPASQALVSNISDQVAPAVPADPGTPTGQPSGTISNGYIWPFPEGEGRVSQGRHADNAFDFAAPKGTPIYAVHDGTVLIAHPSGYNGGFGLYVVIDFTDGRQAIFGHMSKVLVQAGDIVKQGDVIGLVGTTGHSTGNHLHLGFHGTGGNPYIGLKVNDKDLIKND